MFKSDTLRSHVIYALTARGMDRLTDVHKARLDKRTHGGRPGDEQGKSLIRGTYRVKGDGPREERKWKTTLSVATMKKRPRRRRAALAVAPSRFTWREAVMLMETSRRILSGRSNLHEAGEGEKGPTLATVVQVVGGFARDATACRG